jgi:DNA (cytosine-5)-methyltransferase 1
MGWHRSGFEVWGVDFFPQPDFPFPDRFIQTDALEYLFDHGGEYDAHDAGPPCQASTGLTKGTNQAMGWGRTHFDLINDTRIVLTDWEKPFVIENVSGAKIRKDVTLCGEMFGLSVIRHRHFELGGWSVERPEHIKHRGRVQGWRHGVYYDGPYFAVHGDGGGKGSLADWQRAMGIDWITDKKKLAEAIPPAYTEWLGRRLLEAMK